MINMQIYTITCLGVVVHLAPGRGISARYEIFRPNAVDVENETHIVLWNPGCRIQLC